MTSEKTSGRAWSAAEKVAVVAIIVNALLTGGKFLLAWLSGSLALKVEAFHSFADIGSSMAVFLAVRSEMGRRDEPEEASGRASLWKNPQRMVAIGIGLFLAAVGVLFIRKVISPETILVNYPVPVALAMLILALLSFLLSRLERVTGERDGCTGLVADSFHARVDMAGSLVVAAALLGESLGLAVDRWAALVISVYILSQAVNVFGRVVRDFAKGESEPDIIYREWLWQEVRRRLPNFLPGLVSLVTRLRGGSPDSEDDRKKSGAFLIIAAVVILLALYLASGLFTVGPSERAVIERLGRPLNMDSPLGPGIHAAWPWPVDRVRRVDVDRIRSMNVGSAVKSGRRTVLWTNAHYTEQFNLLSGENIFVDVGVVIHYRVADVSAWLYNCRDPEYLLQRIAYALLTQEFAKRRFMASVTSNRDELERFLFEKLKEELEPFNAGIELVSFHVRDAHPPVEVAPDFERVVSATIEYETLINEAAGYKNDLIPRARGEAARKELDAGAEAVSKVNRASGEAERFELTLEAYRAGPMVYRIRRTIETAEEVLPGREKIILPPGAGSGDIELFMTANPGRLPGQEKANE